MTPKQSNKRTKLATLKGILSGTISFRELRPQQLYFVDIKDGIYSIKLGRGDEPLILKSEAEYQKWKALNVRPGVDILFLTDLSEPQITKEQAKKYVPQEPVKNPVFTMPVFEPKKLLTEAKEAEVAKAAVKKVIEPVPVKRTSGRLSEYGTTWECQRN